MVEARGGLDVGDEVVEEDEKCPSKEEVHGLSFLLEWSGPSRFSIKSAKSHDMPNEKSA